MIKTMHRWLLAALLAVSVGLPAQAGMVGTAQMHNAAVPMSAAAIETQRDWIAERLVEGGVDGEQARLRVAAMTDAQVSELHRRIDEAPAGGADALVLLILVLIFTEVMGYTDIFPD